MERVLPVVNGIRAWAEGEPDIRLALVIGSQARDFDAADDQSDVDLLITARDPQRWLDDADWLTAVAPPLVTFVEESGLPGVMERRVLFADGVDVDFNIVAHERVEAMAQEGMPLKYSDVIARGHHVLIDKDALLPALMATGLRRVGDYDPPTPEAFTHVVPYLLYYGIWSARKARRGELYVALSSLDGCVRTALIRLLCWRERLAGEPVTAATERDGPADEWYGSRYLHRRLAPDVAARLALTVPRCDRDEIIAAILEALRLADETAGDIARVTGWSYDPAATAEVARMIEAG